MKDVAELCRGLVRKAQSDRAAMEASLAAKVFDAACFHAQQVAEKCLKAFLAYRGVMFPYTHNLTKLVEFCAGWMRHSLPCSPWLPRSHRMRWN
jgi:HEPN domain-containing protein